MNKMKMIKYENEKVSEMCLGCLKFGIRTDKEGRGCGHLRDCPKDSVNVKN